MLEFLRIGSKEPTAGPDPIDFSQLQTEPDRPLSLRTLNDLHPNVKQRIYRTLLPMQLLARFDIDPLTWKAPDKEVYVKLKAAEGSSLVNLMAWSPFDPAYPFFELELQDNSFNSIDLNLIVLSDPDAPWFATNVDAEGNPTMFGTMSRNLPAEQDALQAGLAPGQTRAGLGASRAVFNQIETLLMALGHRSFALEPLTYASAWVFEKLGCAYVRGHKKMDGIHREFQPGGALHAALDGSTPFRQPDQWQTVRGRAWAIHDGILEAVDTSWDHIKMLKPIGRHSRVTTFPDAAY